MSFNFDTMSLVTLLIGLALCFCGFRLRKVGIAIIWFIVGYTISKSLIASYVSDTLTLNGISIGIGVILGVCGYSLEKIGVYVAVGLMTFKFVYSLLTYSQLINIIIAVVCGIILASIAIKFIKPITIIVTALGGSSLFIDGLKSMLNGPSSKVFLIVEIICIVLGIIYQFNANKGSD